MVATSLVDVRVEVGFSENGENCAYLVLKVTTLHLLMGVGCRWRQSCRDGVMMGIKTPMQLSYLILRAVFSSPGDQQIPVANSIVNFLVNANQ